MRKILFVLLLVSVLLFGSFYWVSAERGQASGQANCPSIGQTLYGRLYTNSSPPNGTANATTSMAGYPGVTLTAKLDIKPRTGGPYCSEGKKFILLRLVQTS